MIFNFWYGQHNKFTLTALTDLVTPIYHGLAEAGHRVIGFGTSILPAPVVNVLVEFFPIDAFIEFLLGFRAKFGENLILGVLCPDDVDDAFKMADPKVPRRPNLLRLLPIVDFVWTLAPQVEFYESVLGPGKTALVRYGFTERSLEREIIRNPGLRDIDVVLFADLCDTGSPRHTAVLDGLKKHGFSCVSDYQSGYPHYVTSDIMRRAKVSLDIRSRSEVRFLHPWRLTRALQSGTAVVAEPFDHSPLGEFYRFTQACEHEEMVERCAQIIRGRTYVDLGAAALARFRAETSMRDNMIEALRLPVFDRLRGAAS